MIEDDFDALFDHIADISAHIGALYYAHYYNRIPRYASHKTRNRDEVFVRHILAAVNLSRGLNEFRMSVDAFLKLLKELQCSGGLSDSPTATANQRLTIFLIICGPGVS